jgi:hypothetical protein
MPKPNSEYTNPQSRVKRWLSPRNSRHVREKVTDTDRLRCPVVHQLPVLRKNVLELRGPRELGQATRQDGDIPAVLEVVHDEAEGEGSKRFGCGSKSEDCLFMEVSTNLLPV